MDLGNGKYDITSNAKTEFFMPVKDNSASLIHVINGIDVPVMSAFIVDDGVMYLTATLESYLVFHMQYVAEKKDAGNLTLVYVAVGIIAVLAVAMMVVTRNKH